MDQENLLEPNKPFLKRFWWVGLLVLVLGVGVILLLAQSNKKAGSTKNNFNPKTATQSTDTKTSSSLSECGETKELFTSFPVKEGEYVAITPLGNLNPPGHTFPTDHLYVEVFDPRNVQAYTLDKQKALLAPADMVINSIQSSEEVGGITDWAIDFSRCKDVKGKFGHVGSISEKLKTEIAKQTNKCNEYQTGGHTYRSCKYETLKIQVKNGEQIGTAGSQRSGMLDIWLSDYREPQVKRANPDRWGSGRNDVSCFLDYYPSAQKNQYYELLRGPNGGKRIKEPRCGTVEVDISGTAQGVWFYNLVGQVQGEDPHLALAFDNIETDKQVFSVGNSASSAGISSGRYSFVPKSSGKVNRDFSQVSADGSVYCYDTKNNGASKAILLTLPTAEKLRIGKAATSSCGSGPWTLSNYVEFAR